MMERPEPLHGEYRLGGDPCYRCLKRENEALRAAIARVREHCADILKDYSADALTLTVGEVLDLLDGTR